jgi:DNA invertase Pin-like site-specific DNA recombinase
MPCPTSVSDKKIMKALLLARVSSKEQEEGQSIPAQERRLREYADRKGLVVGQVFKITESSTKDTRKEFEKILEIIRKSKESLALVADTIDRVQRSFKESVVLEELRKEGKVEIHFMQEGLVLNLKSNSSDILRWDMGVMFARSYVLQLSDNVKRSKEQAVKNGSWIGLAPLGYIHIMKKNIQLLVMSLLFFMTADAQAQEWCAEDSNCIDETNFYAKILGGANFLQNTSLEGNKSTYQTGYVVAGSLGYCWHYDLRLEGEYAFRRNGIRKINFFGEGFSRHGHFQTSSYMANLLWDLPLSSWGCTFWDIQPFIGAGIGYDFQQMRSSNSRIVFHQSGTIFLGK